MKRIVLIIAGAAGLALLGVPWLFGALAQQRLETDIARLDADGDVEAAVLDYARGWGTSTATIELSLPPGTLDGADLPPDTPPPVAAALARLAEPVRLHVTMRHGPLLVGDGAGLGLMSSTIRLDPETPGHRALLEELDIPYIFEIRSLTGFDGRSEFVSESPAFSVERGGTRVAFSGSRATGVYDAATRRLTGEGTAASLHVESDDGRFDLEGLTFSSDSTYYNDLLRLGFAEAEVARMSATARGERFVLDGLGVRFDVAPDEQGRGATLSGAYRVARMTDDADIDLSDVEIVATMRRVDLDALTAYYAAMQEAAVQADTAAPLSLGVEDALYDLLSASPELELAPLRLAWNGEPLDATVRLAVNGAALPQRPGFTALALVLQGLATVDASLEVSEALANTLAARGMAYQVRRNAAREGVPLAEDEVQAIAQSQAAIAIASLVAQGMLTSVDGGYATTARFAQGRLTVNGNRVPLGLR